MTSKLTRLTDDELTETLRLATSGYPLPACVEGNLRQAFAELQERRKADSEPVAYMHHSGQVITREECCDDKTFAICCKVETPLYRHAQPAPERDRVRCEHAEWSHATFGNVGPVGPLKHLSKEALEAVAEPGDLSEWADMQFLLWDAQRRAGITDEQIIQAMIEKLAVNKLREWPEPKDGEPRLHIKEQPAPLVMDEAQSRAAFEQWCTVNIERNKWHPEFYAHLPARDQWAAWEACRAIMLNGGKS